MQKYGNIIFRGTTPERWRPEPGLRLLYDLREQRASKAWAKSMVTAPEPGEGSVRYLVRSYANQKPLRLPRRTTSLAIARRKGMKIRRIRKTEAPAPPKIMARLPVEYV